LDTETSAGELVINPTGAVGYASARWTYFCMRRLGMQGRYRISPGPVGYASLCCVFAGLLEAKPARTVKIFHAVSGLLLDRPGSSGGGPEATRRPRRHGERDSNGERECQGRCEYRALVPRGSGHPPRKNAKKPRAFCQFRVAIGRWPPLLVWPLCSRHVAAIRLL